MRLPLLLAGLLLLAAGARAGCEAGQFGDNCTACSVQCAAGLSCGGSMLAPDACLCGYTLDRLKDAESSGVVVYWQLTGDGSTTSLLSDIGNATLQVAAASLSAVGATFDGTAAAVSSDVPLLHHNGNVTIEVWMKLQAAAARSSPHCLAARGSAWQLCMNGSSLYATPGPTVQLGELSAGWHHVAARYDADTGLAQLYLDATLIGTVVAAWPAAAAGMPLVIGGQAAVNDSAAFSGTLRDFAAYADPLTAAKLAEHVAARQAELDGDCACFGSFAGDGCASSCKLGAFGSSCAACTVDCGAHGSCGGSQAANNSCACTQGWTGARCDDCAAGFRGSNCSACLIDCSGHGSCGGSLNASDSCVCVQGWTGAQCDACDADFFAADDGSCVRCPACSAHGRCDREEGGSGACLCDAGWAGALCDDCASGFFGANCSACSLDCGEQGSCGGSTASSDACVCSSGWAGALCSECAAGFFGSDCTPCTSACSGHGSCGGSSLADDSCHCDVGWAGASCATCAADFFGANCTACPDCGPHGACTSDGRCACEPAWGGDDRCSSCAPTFFGEQCAACTVACGAHGSCGGAGSVADACVCAEGWRGDACDDCLPGYFGEQCSRCSQACAHGDCGGSRLSTDVCHCDVGWQGVTCNDCQDGYYGLSCTACSVDCGGHGSCGGSRTVGDRCECAVGWLGALCSECALGFYGADCLPCTAQCTDGGSCGGSITSTNGCSLCARGFLGSLCDSCALGFYGPGCRACSVDCGVHGSCGGAVDAADECVCQEGWSGALCDDCSRGRFGSDCAACTIDCGAHGICGGSTTAVDECVCDFGWAGTLCDECAPGFHGDSCTACIIDCSGHGGCAGGRPAPLACSCDVGWRGELCDDCDDGFYGSRCAACASDCTQRQQCGGSREAADVCFCSAAWRGDDCQLCAPGFYGDDCRACTVDCGAHGSCGGRANATGGCECATGWLGAACDDCAPAYWGAACWPCTVSCGAHGACGGSTAADNRCQCALGWAGAACQDCAAGFYGVGCRSCARDDSGAVCSGHGSCDGSATHGGTGACSCDVGWTGQLCDGCQPGYFGDSCRECPGGGSADLRCSGHGVCIGSGNRTGEGRCDCQFGWTSRACDVVEVLPDLPFSILSAIFSRSGARLFVSFSGDASPLLGAVEDVTDEQATGSAVACTQLFASAVQLLGASCAASWLSPRLLQLQLGSDASVLPMPAGAPHCDVRSSLQPLAGAFRHATIDIKTASNCVDVTAPPDVTPPQVVLDAPTTVGICQTALLDGSASGGSTARALQLTWAADWVDSALEVPLPAALRELLAEASEANADTVQLPAAALSPGLSVRFTLTGKSFLSTAQSVATAVVFKAAHNLPQLTLLGPSQRTVSRSDVLRLRGQARLFDCVGRLQTETTLLWSWTLLAGDWHASDGGPTERTQSLVVAGNRLRAGGFYQWQLRVASGSDAAVMSTATVSVRVRTEGLRAVLSGGDRVVSAFAPLQLDASLSADLDGLPGSLAYLWSCTQPAEPACVLSPAATVEVSLSRTATLSLPALFADVGSRQQFTVHISKGNRTASASVWVSTVAVAPPRVSIAATGGRVNAGRPLRLQGAVDSDEPVRLQWSVVSGMQPLYTAAAAALLFTPTTTLSLGLRADALATASRFVFRLTATPADAGAAAASGSADIEVLVNEAPSGGHVSSDVLEATPLQDVALRAVGWTDEPEDMPLRYTFAAQLTGADAGRDADLLLAPSQLLPRLLAPLPAGAGAGKLVRIAVTVDDTWGARARSSLAADGQPAVVRVAALPLADVLATAAELTAVRQAEDGGSSGSVDALLRVQRGAALATALLPPCAAVACGSHGSCTAGSCRCSVGWSGEVCDVAPVVHGAWTDWSPWSPCSVSCGGGLQLRQRSCAAPLPSGGGNDCDGLAADERPCAPALCSSRQDGGYSAWSEWSGCSAVCPGDRRGRFRGQRTRQRSCTEPTPSANGRGCDALGAAEESIVCFVGPCTATPLLCPGSSSASSSDGDADGQQECSGHGSCSRFPADCGEGESCSVRCLCQAGWGGLDCASNSSTIASAQQLAATVLSDLLDASGDLVSEEERQLEAVALAAVVRSEGGLPPASRSRAVRHVAQLVDEGAASGPLATAQALLSVLGHSLLQPAAALLPPDAAPTSGNSTLAADGGGGDDADDDSSDVDIPAVMARVLTAVAADSQLGDEAVTVETEELSASLLRVSGAEDATVTLTTTTATTAASGSSSSDDASGPPVQLTVPAGELDASAALQLRAVSWKVNPHADGAGLPGSSVVSVSVVQADTGTEVALPSMTTPATLRIPLRADASAASCSYWHVASSSWRTDGLLLEAVERLDDGSSVLRCRTSHFTDFAALLGGAGDDARAAVTLHAQPSTVSSRSLHNNDNGVVIVVLPLLLSLGLIAIVVGRLQDLQTARTLRSIKRLQFALFGRFGLPPRLHRMLHRLLYHLRAQHMWLSVLVPPVEQLALASRPQRALCLLAVVLTQMAANALLYQRRHECAEVSFSAATIAGMLSLPLAIFYYGLFWLVNADSSVAVRHRERLGQLGTALLLMRDSPAPPSGALAISIAPAMAVAGAAAGAAAGRDRRASLSVVAAASSGVSGALLALSGLAATLLGLTALCCNVAYYFTALLAREVLVALAADALLLFMLAVAAAVVLRAQRPLLVAVTTLLLLAAIIGNAVYAVSLLAAPGQLPLLDAALQGDWTSLRAAAAGDFELRAQVVQLQETLGCCGFSAPTDGAIGGCVSNSSLPGCAAQLPAVAWSQLQPLAQTVAIVSCSLLFLVAVLTLWLRANDHRRRQYIAAVDSVKTATRNRLEREAKERVDKAKLRRMESRGPPSHGGKLRHDAAIAVQRVWRGYNTRLGTTPLLELQLLQRQRRLRTLLHIAAYSMMLLIVFGAAYTNFVVGLKFSDSNAWCWLQSSLLTIVVDILLQQPLLAVARVVFLQLGSTAVAAVRAAL